MQILKGAPVAAAIKEQIIETLTDWKEAKPCLAIVRIGEKDEDLSYERGAVKRLEELGMETRIYVYPENISMEAFEAAFCAVNQDPQVDGILLFRPLPSQIDEARIVSLIDPGKDVDGISSASLAKVFTADRTGFAPCTAQAVMELLHHYGISPEGKKTVVLGRSLVVGKPLSMLLLNENATVTICHSRTKEIRQVCREAEVVISAIGKARWVDESFLADNAIVIDVGINMDENGRLCGDVDFERIQEKASMATPVPRGVGSVTTAVLAKHVLEAAQRRRGGRDGISAD